MKKEFPGIHVNKQISGLTPIPLDKQAEIGATLKASTPEVSIGSAYEPEPGSIPFQDPAAPGDVRLKAHGDRSEEYIVYLNAHAGIAHSPAALPSRSNSLTALDEAFHRFVARIQPKFLPSKPSSKKE